MRRQYHFRQTDQGMLIWDVHRLIALSRELPVREVPLSKIAELDEAYWFGSADAPTPTCRHIAEHAQLMEEADLRYPIILCAEGRVMDGMHRACKALLAGRSFIRARRFECTPPHHFIDVPADQLCYEDIPNV